VQRDTSAVHTLGAAHWVGCTVHTARKPETSNTCSKIAQNAWICLGTSRLSLYHSFVSHVDACLMVFVLWYWIRKSNLTKENCCLGFVLTVLLPSIPSPHHSLIAYFPCFPYSPNSHTPNPKFPFPKSQMHQTLLSYLKSQTLTPPKSFPNSPFL